MNGTTAGGGGRLAWPGGATSAACITLDLDGDEVWLAEHPSATDRPGMRSQGEYGVRVGLHLLLGILDRHEVPATFFVPGRVAERYADSLDAIIDRGHEVAHHGYTHRAPAQLTAAEEEAELVRGLDVLRAREVDVRGYRAPSWDVSPRTIELLQRHGLEYASNLMADVVPYRHDGTDIIELPVHWTLDDAAHFWFGPGSWTKKIATNAEALAIWSAEAAGIGALGGLCVHTFHPQIIGRPGRLSVFEEIVATVAGQADTWMATAGDIARWAARELGATPHDRR